MKILIGSIPTIEKDDLELAERVVHKEENIDGSTEILKKKLQNIFTKKEVYLFNRGREALAFALRSIGIKKEDEVIVQAMTCIAVVNPILSLKATPIFVDIKKGDFNMDLEDLKRKVSNKTKAIIVQHTFGRSANIKEIYKIAQKYGIFIIEDCAHLFLMDYSKSLVNKYSDISFFSFAQDKSITCTQGGLAVVNNEKLKENANRIYDTIGDQSYTQSIYHANYIRLWSLIKKYYFAPLIPFPKRVTIGKVLVILFRYLGLIKQQSTEKIENNIEVRKMSDVQSRLLLNQLNKCDMFNKHRVEITKVYKEKLDKRFDVQETNEPLLRLPLLVENPAEALIRLREQGYICGRWYNTIVYPVKWNNLSCIGYKMGTCINAENWTKKIINLPTSIDVSRQDVLNICKIVNEYAK